ncbi:MAG: glycosyltransferase family 39 protein [Clostridiales bacterium]|nr:glycosyltransferase family 39 protein [Clostridiales bacterium]
MPVKTSIIGKTRWSIFQDGRVFYWCLLFFVLISLFLMIRSGMYNGLWSDEIATLRSLRLHDRSLMEYLGSFWPMGTRTPNAFFFFARIWLEIGGLNDVWLLLMCALMVAGAVYLVGLIGRHILGGTAGIISAVLFGFSYHVFQVAHQFRFYPWLVLFTALSLYLFCRLTLEKKAKPQLVILFGIAMGLTVTGQILAGFILACFFVVDLVLVRLGAKQKRILFSYVVAAPFGVLLLSRYFVRLSAEDSESYLALLMDPNLSNLVRIPEFMLGGTGPMLLLFNISIALAILLVFANVLKRPLLIGDMGFEGRRKQLLFVFIAIVPWVCIIMNYAALQAMGGLANMFASRYFQYLYPLIYLSIGLALVYIFVNILKIDKRWLWALALALLLYFAPQAYTSSLLQPSHTGMKHGAAWIIENQEAIGGDVTIMAPVHAAASAPIVYDLYFRNRYNVGDVEVKHARGRSDIADVDTETVVIYSDQSSAAVEEMLSERYERDRLSGSGVDVWRKIE